MYKIFAYSFFGLTIVTFFSLIFFSDYLFDKNYMWYVIIFHLLIYGSFVLYILFTTFFTLRDNISKVLSKISISKKFPKIQKFFKENKYSLDSISNILGFFLLVSLILTCFVFSTGAGVGYLLNKYPYQISTGLDLLFEGEKYSEQINSIEKKMNDIVYEISSNMEDEFLSQNSYRYVDGDWMVRYMGPESSTSLNNKYEFALYHCPNTYDHFDCDYVAPDRASSYSLEDTVPENYFIRLSQNEKIESMYVEEVFVDFMSVNPVIVTIETNIRSVSFFVFPSYNLDNEYAYYLYDNDLSTVLNRDKLSAEYEIVEIGDYYVKMNRILTSYQYDETGVIYLIDDSGWLHIDDTQPSY